MDVTMKAKTIGTASGAGIGLFSAAAVADDLATVSLHHLHLDPTMPPDVLAAWTRLITMAYGLTIAGAVAAVGRLISPGETKETNDAKGKVRVPGS